VVAPERAAQSGEVGVIDRAPAGFCRPVQVRQRDVDCFAASSQAAAAKQWRRFGGPTDHPRPRARVVERTRHRCAGIGHRARDHRHRSPQRAQGPVDHIGGQVVEPFAHQVVGRQILRNGLRRGRLCGRIPLEIVDLGEHLHTADSVSDGVGQVQQRCSLSVGETLDQGGCPQRSGDVQRRLQHHLR
jgi:hypothetical protein